MNKRIMKAICCGCCAFFVMSGIIEACIGMAVLVDNTYPSWIGFVLFGAASLSAGCATFAATIVGQYLLKE